MNDPQLFIILIDVSAISFFNFSDGVMTISKAIAL